MAEIMCENCGKDVQMEQYDYILTEIEVDRKVMCLNCAASYRKLAGLPQLSDMLSEISQLENDILGLREKKFRG